jgi:hypothetical protein
VRNEVAGILPSPQAPAEVPAAPSLWLRPAECARIAKVGPQMIYKAVRRKQLRAARVGGKREIRVLDIWLRQWLESTAEPIDDTQKGALRVAR